jgi:serine/threonine protein kinase
MYRDLKPENVLLDSRGCAKLADFGCCKKALSTSTIIGTPEYMAPEVIKGHGYSCSCDWWSLGVMLFEFVVGPLPFADAGEEQTEIFKAILEAPIVIPKYITDPTAHAAINGFMQRRIDRRLGGSLRDAKEIKEHPYFKDFYWFELAAGVLEPPWCPNVDALNTGWEREDADLSNYVGNRDEIPVNVRGMDWAKTF